MSCGPAKPQHDVLKETRLTLNQLTEHKELSGESVAYTTVVNWCTTGVYNTGRTRRVYLERKKAGGVWYTSIEAYQRFVAEINDEGCRVGK